jgi:hypothetical protein
MTIKGELLRQNFGAVPYLALHLRRIEKSRAFSVQKWLSVVYSLFWERAVFRVVQRDSTMIVRRFAETAMSSAWDVLAPALLTVLLVGAIEQLTDYAFLPVHLTTLPIQTVSACLIKARRWTVLVS